MATIGRRRSHTWGTTTISSSTDCTSGIYTGEVCFTPSGEDASLSDVSVSSKELDGITLTVESTTSTSTTLSVSVNADASEVPPQQTAYVRLSFNSGDNQTAPLKLLSAFPLSCLHHVFEGTHSEQLVTRIHTRYDKSAPMWSLFSFLQDCECLLSFEETVTLMNTLAGYNPGFRDQLNDTSDRFFKNLLLHKKQYRVSSRNEYDRYRELFNEQPNLAEIDEYEVEKHYLSDWRDADGDMPTDPEMFGFAATSTATEITNPEFIEWVAESVLEERIEAVKDRLSPEECRHTEEQYQKLKEKAQEGPPVQRADTWATLLADATLKHQTEFEFVLGNFLYWQGIHQHAYEYDRKDRVFGAAALLFYRTNVPVHRQKSNCNQHITRAHQLRIEGEFGDALYNARKALSIATNESGQWETVLDTLAARARRDCALFQRNILLTENAYDGAITVLDDAREDIIQKENIPDRFRLSLVHHIDANRYEVAARRAEEEGELMNAKQYLERAFYHFDKCNRTQRKSFIKGRLDDLIERIREEEYDDAFKERDRRQAQPGEEESGRDPSFRGKILDAYDCACAFCGARRKTPDGRFEVHAAHIQPVRDDGPDLVQNGLALCRLHHWAFDNGWLAIDTNHTIRVADHTDTDGYDEFARLDGQDLQSPNEDYQKPGTDFILYHLQEHGFVEEDTTPDRYPEDLTEEELADATSTELTETTSQDTSSVSKYSKIISEGDIVGSKNDLLNSSL